MTEVHPPEVERPSPREIQDACQEIQKTWSEKDRRRRKVMRRLRLPILEYVCVADGWQSRQVG